jgi:hypothetical protein
MSEGPDASWRRTLNHVLTAVKKIELIFARSILITRGFICRRRSFADDGKLAGGASHHRTEIGRALPCCLGSEVHVLAALLRRRQAGGSPEICPLNGRHNLPERCTFPAAGETFVAPATSRM